MSHEIFINIQSFYYKHDSAAKFSINSLETNS